MLLPQMEYKFKNLTKEEYSNGKVFYFYCDNLQEGVHILSWLEEYNPEMRLVKRGYKGHLWRKIYNNYMFILP